VTDLPTETIIIRAVIGWLVGLIGTGLIAGYLEAHSNGSRSFWIVIPILAARILLLLGPAGMGLAVSRATRHLDEIASYLAVGVTIVVSLWLSMIGAQVAKNIACIFFGAKTEPIRWWPENSGRRSKQRKKPKRKQND
jgi:hypothetical protein